MKYEFCEKLIEGLIIKRNSQFTVEAEINGNIEKVHCPTTGRIGDIDLKNIPCLLSRSDNSKRKTKFTLEAISVNDKKQWLGINQIASNKYIEFFLKNNSMKKLIDNPKEIKREVKLGNSKLDFMVDNTYIEVKTPLQTLQIEYGKNIKTKPVREFSSTDRFVKHINELSNSLNENQRAILLNVFQYDNPGYKIINKSTNYHDVKNNVKKCIENGIEIWQVNMEITHDCIELKKYWDTTDNFIG